MQSHLPSEIICRNLKLILKKQNAPASEKSKSADSHLSLRSSVSSTHSPMSPIQSGELGIPSRDDMPQRIMVQPQLIIASYRQDSSQIYSVMCKNTHQVLRRRDSQGFHKDDITEEDSGPCFKNTMVKFVPGLNVVTIQVKVCRILVLLTDLKIQDILKLCLFILFIYIVQMDVPLLMIFFFCICD